MLCSLPLSIKSILSASVLSVVADVVPDPASTITKYTEIGLLTVAVVVLWRKVQEKDGLLMQNYKSMAESLATSEVVQKKMADTLEEIKKTVEQLSTVRSQLVRFPSDKDNNH